MSNFITLRRDQTACMNLKHRYTRWLAALSLSGILATSASGAVVTDANQHVNWIYSGTSASPTNGATATSSHAAGGVAMSITGGNRANIYNYIASEIDSSFNLNEGGGLLLEVDNLQLGGAATTLNQHKQIVFTFTGNPNILPYNAKSTSISLYIDASARVRFGFNDGVEGWPYSTSTGTVLINNEAIAAAAITGFTLKLMPKSYELLLKTSNPSRPVVEYRGLYDLGEGWDTLGLNVSVMKGGVDGSVTASIGELKLAAIPEGSMASVTAGGIFALLALRKRLSPSANRM